MHTVELWRELETIEKRVLLAIRAVEPLECLVGFTAKRVDRRNAGRYGRGVAFEQLRESRIGIGLISPIR